MQPSGTPQLGNYLGAIKNWVGLQEDYSCRFCVADLHSVTVRQDPESLRQNSLSLFALFLAAGLDHERGIVYFQSHVPAHTQLTWALSCLTYMGELNRMTQFKDKSQKHSDNINAGLYTYPVLMAADILLFRADLVPVGEDQTQHVELCRDVAERFNNLYGDILTVPEPFVSGAAARVMGLSEPSRKMSKSENGSENNVVFLTDPPEIIAAKFKRAVTDSDNQVRFDPENKPGVSNLINIYRAVTGKTVPETEKEFENSGYGAFKTAVAESVIAELSPLQDRYSRLMADAPFLEAAVKRGAERAAEEAAPLLKKVMDAVGFAPR
jgi:tryptophanyl-tRNA synthetase